MQKLYLGRAARWPNSSGPQKWDDYKSITVPVEDIINIIPWDEVPQRLQQIALDRYRPLAGTTRHLVLLRSGDAIPSALGKGLIANWHHARRRAGRRRWIPTEKQLHDELRADGWATIAEIAQITGYNPWHLRLLARENRIPAQKIHGRWWLHQKSTQIYAASHRGPKVCKSEEK